MQKQLISRNNMAETPKINGRIAIDEPLWLQDTFMGRLKHFAWVTDFRTVVEPTNRLYEAKELVEKYRYVISSRGGVVVRGIPPLKKNYKLKFSSGKCCYRVDLSNVPPLQKKKKKKKKKLVIVLVLTLRRVLPTSMLVFF